MDDLISDVYGEHWKSNPKIVKMVDKMQADNEGYIDLPSWTQICKNHAYLLYPAFNMQKCLREGSMGVSFWRKKETERSDVHGKDYAAQEGLLAKLVAAPGEYDRKETLDLDALMKAEEDEKAKAGVKESESDGDDEDEDGIGSDELSSTMEKEVNGEGEGEDDEDKEEYTEEQIAHLLKMADDK